MCTSYIPILHINYVCMSYMFYLNLIFLVIEIVGI